MSSYDQIVSAVLNYYSSDSDIYKKVASGQGLTVGEMNAVLSSVPYMEPVTSISGSRIGIDASIPFKEPSNNIEFVVGDSNLGGSSYGSGYSGNIPGTSTYDSSTSTFTIESGANNNGSILPVVADKLSLAVTGVNIGAKLGFKIDELLYENFPNFWENLFGSSTPADFANIFSEDTLGNKFLRALFGISNDYYTTCYVPEDAIALLYRLLRDNGIISNSIEESTYDEAPADWGVTQPVPHIGASSIKIYRMRNGSIAYIFDFEGDANVVPCTTGGIFYSTKPDVVLTRYAESPSTPRSPLGTYGLTGTYTYNNLTVWCHSYAETYAEPSSYGINVNQTGGTKQAQIAWIAAYGTKKVPQVIPGISQMDSSQAPLGTPDPTIIDGTDVPTILSQLKENYPDLFQNPITQNIPQEDGTTRTITYYPVPFPQPQATPTTETTPRPTTQTTPTTGTTPQVLPQTDPETGTTTYVVPTIDEDTATKILEDPLPTTEPITEPIVQPVPTPEPSPDPTPQPDTPVTPSTPPPGTNPPDTGEGEAEPIVLPVGEASALWAVYNPTQGQLNQFGAWLWSPNFIDNIIRIFTSPMDGIIGVHKVYATPPRGGSQNITVGYLDSGVSSVTVPQQFTEVPCGSVDLLEYYGNVFDYSPFTEVSIYLPFIGVAKLDVADVMRSRISVSYGVDVYTGSCLAKISVERDGYDSVLYSFGGDCAVHYPLSSGSYSGLISSIVSAGASALASGIASGGNPVMGAVAAGSTFLSHNKGLSVNHTGGFTGNSGATGPKIPYLIIKRPQVLMADKFEQYDGYPANHTTSIGSCSGYIRCKEVHLKVPNAYREELSEIESILKQGILVT